MAGPNGLGIPPPMMDDDDKVMAGGCLLLLFGVPLVLLALPAAMLIAEKLGSFLFDFLWSK